MEFTLPPIPYELVALLLFVLALKLFHKKKATKYQSKLRLPPGPWTLPLIGSLHHLVSGKLPHRALRDLARSHGPIMLLRAGQIDLVIITSREAAQEVMRTQDANFSDRPLLFTANMCNSGSDIVFSKGAYWRQLRRVCLNGLLSSKKVKFLSSIRHEEVNHMLKLLSTLSDEKSPVTLVKMVSDVANNIVARATFGGNCKRQDVFLKALKNVIEQISWFSLSDLFPWLSGLEAKMKTKSLQIYRNLDTLMDEIIQEHLEMQKQLQKNGDEEIEYTFIDVLMNAMGQDNGGMPITFDSVKAVILDMFSGGIDTTATIIEWTMAELMKHPEKMAKVQAEIRQAACENMDFNENDLFKLNYLKCVVKESVRLHPPLPLLLPRQCNEMREVLGYSIPSGARVLINGWALGTDPNYWSDAEKFIPERFEGSSIDFKGNNFEFVQFGAGRRSCPGAEFGMAIIEIILARLLLHFDWKLSDDGIKPNDLDMAEEFAAVLRKKAPLSLVPVLRVSLSNV
ncbi:cytochrome P450 family 71 polypeptide [Rhynchospora pubera]|uniref:Cytochrome P450 family 71 polypeptide n=1 Tax=Rhynchospora pubera TaxID=906938 RepID=A0AAV8C782_9POAL|nr:cytochrome P450 family 71 polypeptide [Rhynchospora pubera]